MHPTSRPRVKVCCMASVEEAAIAVRLGAAAVGLVSAMPSGPGPIPEELIAEIAPTVPPGVATFLLTSRQDVPSIVAQQRRCRANTLQTVDHLVTGTHAELRDALPGIGIVQVVHVTGPEAFDEAVRVAPFVDAILLDSGNQSLAVKELGGTGRRHDWAVSRRIREAVGVPVWLAGGLAAGNVVEAVETVRPFGVDVCSGVRSTGRLDPAKLEAFIRAVEKVAGAAGPGV
ncbi:MAG: phosphoribosylanthranilate isomerase [Gemmataceae bacterium]|nr:phosphoribosylanthranilate isomerase [Gemmataceae bacterium]